MKKLFLIMALVLLFSVTVQADSSVTFTWLPNSESDLKEYRLYQTDVSGDYVPGVDIPVAVIPAGTETITMHNVADGTWFWIMTAADFHENESSKSNEVTKGLDTIVPDAVDGLDITTTVTIKVRVE